MPRLGRNPRLEILLTSTSPLLLLLLLITTVMNGAADPLRLVVELVVLGVSWEQLPKSPMLILTQNGDAPSTSSQVAAVLARAVEVARVLEKIVASSSQVPKGIRNITRLLILPQDCALPVGERRVPAPIIGVWLPVVVVPPSLHLPNPLHPPAVAFRKKIFLL